MPSHPSINTNRVVVALLDGRRLSGYVYDFSPAARTLNVFPSRGDPDDLRPAANVEIAACKAVFFVRTHAGDPSLAALVRRTAEEPRRRAPRGRKMRIVFCDGEEMACCAEVYGPRRAGFFVYPLDARSNNLRIFIVNANVRRVLTGRTLDAAANRRPDQDRVLRAAPSPDPPGEGGEGAAEDLRSEIALRVLGGESPADLGREYGIPSADATSWTRSFLGGGRAALSGDGAAADPGTRALLAGMRGRIRDLEKDVERLRKAAAPPPPRTVLL